MRISRTTLSCVLRIKLYETYLTGATFRDGAEIDPRATVAYSIVPDRGPRRCRHDGSAFSLMYTLRLSSCG